MINVASLSGGWDSSIMFLYLTGYLKDGSTSLAIPDIVGVFTDPGREHPATYAMLNTLEAMTNRPIIRLHGPTWEQALEAHAYFIPWHRARWCTPTFKIRPFQAWAATQPPMFSYIGLRADEQQRTGYLGDKGASITPHYPLREMGLTYQDRQRLGRQVGLPTPAPWSCDCCWAKNHILWVELVEQYPDRAAWCAHVEAEKQRRNAGSFGWMRGHAIQELIDNPTLRSEIRRRYYLRHQSADQLQLLDDQEPETTPCLMCQIK